MTFGEVCRPVIAVIQGIVEKGFGYNEKSLRMTPLQEKLLYCFGYCCSSSQRGLGGALGAGGLDESSAKELLSCRVLKWRSLDLAYEVVQEPWRFSVVNSAVPV